MSDRKKEAKPFSWSSFIFFVYLHWNFTQTQPPADKIVIFIGILFSLRILVLWQNEKKKRINDDDRQINM